jgi:hypothetical protein
LHHIEEPYMPSMYPATLHTLKQQNHSTYDTEYNKFDDPNKFENSSDEEE